MYIYLFFCCALFVFSNCQKWKYHTTTGEYVQCGILKGSKSVIAGTLYHNRFGDIDNSPIQIFARDDGKLLWNRTSEGGSISTSSNGELVVTLEVTNQTSRDLGPVVWEVSDAGITKKWQTTLKDLLGYQDFGGVHLSSDGTLLVADYSVMGNEECEPSGCWYFDIFKMDQEKPNLRHVAQSMNFKSVSLVRISRDGSKLMWYETETSEPGHDPNAYLVLMDLESGKILFRDEFDAAWMIFDADITSDGRFLMIAGDKFHLYEKNGTTWKEIKNMELPGYQDVMGAKFVNNDGDYVLLASPADLYNCTNVYFYNRKNDQLVWHKNYPVTQSEYGGLYLVRDEESRDDDDGFFATEVGFLNYKKDTASIDSYYITILDIKTGKVVGNQKENPIFIPHSKIDCVDIQDTGDSFFVLATGRDPDQWFDQGYVYAYQVDKN